MSYHFLLTKNVTFRIANPQWLKSEMSQKTGEIVHLKPTSWDLVDFLMKSTLATGDGAQLYLPIYHKFFQP